jgi:predicted Fe-S protein YdhL (DUF1289 family)
MTSSARLGFSRSLCFDGKTVSFCNGCLLTVAESGQAEKLDRAEQSHICDRQMLAEWSAQIHGGRPPGQEPD